MQLERFTDVNKFESAAQPFLLRHEADNNLPLGLISNLKHDPLQYGSVPPYMIVVRDVGEIVAVALRTPPHFLVLAQMDNTTPIPLILPDVISEFGTDIPGLLGPSKISAAAVEMWQAQTGIGYERIMAERAYQLEKVNPVAEVPGSMRPIKQSDRDLLVEWIYDFAIEANLPEGGDRAGAEAGIERALSGKGRRYYVWEVESQPVSLAGCTGETPNGIRIGPVYTPLDARRKGYATALVAHLSQLLLDEGRRYCFLFTDLSNGTSNHIYQEIGYQPVCDVDMYRFVS
ncbi:MAG: GNAT family N-acetyltransferase [Anaerolineae bacterium]|nr:GNAT family N-acetyltransferase [Anaerolineae bacterium]